MRGPIRVASWPMQSGAISSSTASFAEATARNPKASPQPSNPLSVVTLTSSESAAGRLLSPQAEAAAGLKRNAQREGFDTRDYHLWPGGSPSNPQLCWGLLAADALAPSTLSISAVRKTADGV